jgi:hypothetical protein
MQTIRDLGVVNISRDTQAPQSSACGEPSCIADNRHTGTTSFTPDAIALLKHQLQNYIGK